MVIFEENQSIILSFLLATISQVKIWTGMSQTENPREATLRHRQEMEMKVPKK